MRFIITHSTLKVSRINHSALLLWIAVRLKVSHHLVGQHVLLEERVVGSNDVSWGLVRANIHLAVGAGLDTTANFSSRLPNDLSKVTSSAAET